MLFQTTRFPMGLGQIVATPGALEALARSKQDASLFLARHSLGDWGDLGHDDREANEQALRDGSRVFSSYQLSQDERIWVITEAVDDDGQRASTCILLPEEY